MDDANLRRSSEDDKSDGSASSGARSDKRARLTEASSTANPPPTASTETAQVAASSTQAASEGTLTKIPREVAQFERSLKALYTYLSKNKADEFSQAFYDTVLSSLWERERLISEKDEKFQKVVEATDKVVAEKDLRLNDLEASIAKLEASIAKLEAEQAAAQSELIAVVNTRPLVENGAHKFSPTARSTTGAVEYLVYSTLLENNRLRDHARTWLAELEDAQSQELTKLELSVVKELQVLYHELSKKVHHPQVPLDRGFVCGGTLPFRAAVALVLLELQKRQLMNYPILYTNESFTPRKTFANGVITDYAASSTT